MYCKYNIKDYNYQNKSYKTIINKIIVYIDFDYEFCIMNTLENIKRIREVKKLSQTEVAEQLGIAYQNYWKIENGKTELSLSRLEQISTILGVSLGELLGIDAPDSKKSDEEIEPLKKRIEELEKYIHQIESAWLRLNDFFENYIESQISKNYLKSDNYDLVIIVTNKDTEEVLFLDNKMRLIKIVDDEIKRQLAAQDDESFKEGIKEELEVTASDFFLKLAMSDKINNEAKARMNDSTNWESRIKEINKIFFGNLYRLQTFLSGIFTESKHPVKIDFEKNDEIRRLAANFYFYNSNIYPDDSVKIIMQSGVIQDEIILNSFKKATKLKKQRIAKGFKVDENLDIVPE